MSNNDSGAPSPADERGISREPKRLGRTLLVEILYFDGCPNYEPALALVVRVSRELGLEPEVRLLDVPDQQTAEQMRFLGSPTIRIGGIDVDPSTEDRSDYALACRVFQTEAGPVGPQPDERWVRAALAREAGTTECGDCC